MKFWNKKRNNGKKGDQTKDFGAASEALEKREFLAEALEARVMFSAAPMEAPVEPQVEHVVTEPENPAPTEGDFDPIETFTQAFDAGKATGLASEADLRLLAAEAESRWAATGLNEDQLAVLRTIRFEIRDLQGLTLGYTEGNRIVIDDDAAGMGWFVDATPWDDAEFSADETGVLRATDGVAQSRIDLMTVLMHEMGHTLGLKDLYGADDRPSLMYGGFEAGERRLPAEGQADGAAAGSVAERANASLTVTHLLDSGVGSGSLREAIKQAADGDTITLVAGTYELSITGTDDNSNGGDLDINNKTITIQGAGKDVTIIDAKQIDRVFHIFGGSNVTIKDLTITGGLLTYSHGAGIYADGSTLVLENVRIDNNVTQSTGGGDRHGGGLYLNNATVTGTGVDITNNRAERNGGANNSVGGGAWINGDTSVTLTNVVITGNTAREGGGFYISVGNYGGSSVTLTNATIDNNVAQVRGGGFYNAAIDGKVTVNGGSISGNTANDEHGGGFNNYAGSVTLVNVAINNNQTLDLDNASRHDGNGAGFFNSTGTVTMTGGSLQNNTAYGHGGGFFNRVGTVTITGTTGLSVTIGDNKAGANDGGGSSRHGGGFYNGDGGVVSLTQADFSGNNVSFLVAGNHLTVNGLGGGFFNTGQSIVNLHEVSISNHTAAEGGAFYQDGVKSQVIGTAVTLDNNTAITRGGAFANRSTGALVKLTDSFIRGNTARNEHGGGFYTNGTVSLANSVISGNTTLDLDGGVITNLNVAPANTSPNTVQRDGYGAGFYNAGGNVILAGGTINSNQAYGHGGGFANSGGMVTADGTAITGNMVLRDSALHTSSNYNRHGAGFFNDSDGTVNLINVTLANNVLPTDTAGNTRGVGGGFYNSGAFVNISGSSVISDNRAEEGGGFYSDTTGSVVTITGAVGQAVEIIHNEARIRGGAFRSTGNTNVIMQYVEVVGNVAEQERGGAIYADGARITGSNVKINNNHAGSVARTGDEQGGGIWLSGFGWLELSHSEIKGNRTEVNGGGFYSDNGVVVLNNTSVADNVAFNSGGGGMVTGVGRIELTDSSVAGNIARDHGGGFYTTNDAVITALRSRLDGNIAGYELDGVTRRAADLRGGAFYAIERSQVTLTDSTLDGNTAAMYAGGGYVGGETRVKILSSTVAENIGGHHGGAFFVESSGNLFIQNSTLSGNWAGFRLNTSGDPIYVQESVGGAIWNSGGATVTTLEHVTVTNNFASRTDGAGLHVSSGSVSVTNSIIFGNIGNAEGVPSGTDTQNAITLIGSNVLGNHGGALLGNIAGRITADPVLGILAANGGFGRTHSISSTGSAAGAAIGSTLGADQRGLGRPAANRDLGSFEADPATAALTLTSLTVPENLVGGVAFDVSVEGVTAGDGALSYAWEVRDSAGSVLTSGTGDSAALTASLPAAHPSFVDRVTITVTVTDALTGQTASQSSQAFLVQADATPPVAGTAGTITVTTGSDVVDAGDGVTSLREAIIAANTSGPGSYVILIDPSVTVLTLSIAATDENAALNGDLDITKTNGAVYVVGNGIGVTTISGGGIDRVFDIDRAAVLFKDLKITGGVTTASDHGAGFRNRGGTVVLQNVDLAGNDADRGTAAGNVGGGFYSTRSGILAGRVLALGGFIRDNQADSHGGGFFIDDPNMAEGFIYLKDVTISGNKASDEHGDRKGGGFYFSGTGNRIVADNVILDGNTSIDDGGGFYWGASASVGEFKNVILRNNTAWNPAAGQQNSDGGAFGLAGTRNVVTFAGSAIGQIGAGNISERNAGGFLMEGRHNVLHLVNVSIAGNQADNGTGGGFYVVNDSETVNISGNSQIVNNTTRFSGNHGGGFRNDGVVNITGTSSAPILIEYNSAGTDATGNVDVVGGAFFNTSNGTVNLVDVIIRNNDAYARGGGFFNSSGGQVILSSSNPTVFRSSVSANSARVDSDGTAAHLNKGFGGGFYNSGAFSLVSLTDAVMTLNTAADYAGGFHTESNFSRVDLTRVDITQNSAVHQGGGFHVASNGSLVNLDTVLIDRNVSTHNHGGGFRNNGIINGLNVTITNNAVGVNLSGTPTPGVGDLVGGGFYNSSGQITLVGAIIEDNYGRGRGGGFYSDGGGAIDISSSGAMRSSISRNWVDSNSRDGGGFFVASSGNVVRLNGVDVKDNVAGRHGGGFYLVNDNALVELIDVLIDGNVAGNILGTGGMGGGFHNASAFSVVILDRVVITNNSTLDNHAGGFHNRGRVFGQDVIISNNIAGSSNRALNNDINNVGGGFRSTGSESITELTHIVMEGNTAHGRGGGWYSDGSSIVRLTDFAIIGNSTDQGTSETQGRGGGFWNSGNADVTLIRGEISENESFGHGGGFYQQDAGSSVSLANVTISGNRAGIDQTNGNFINDTVGGGFYAISAGAIAMDHVTITNNQVNRNGADGGAGFRVDSAGNRILMTNSIVYGNFRDADATPIADDVDNRTTTSVDFRLIGNNIIGVRTGNAIGGNLAGLTSSNPNLGALADNGGILLPTGQAARSHALTLSSVAALDRAFGSSPDGDQRGFSRTFDGNAAADLGAFEYSPLEINRGDVVIQLNSAGDQIQILDQSTGSLIVQSPLASTPAIIIIGTAKDDTVIVDFVHGNPIPVGGLFIDGQAHTLGDNLILRNGTFDTVIHTMTSANDGMVELIGASTSVITYRNMDLATVDRLNAVNRVVNLHGAGAEAISLVQAAPVHETLSGEALFDSGIGAAATASTTFGNLGGGFASGDILDVTGRDADGTAFNTSFTVGDVNTNTLGDLLAALDAVFGSSSIDLVDGVIRIVADAAGPATLGLALAISSRSTNTGNTSAAPLGLFDILLYGSVGGNGVSINSTESLGVTFGDQSGGGTLTVNGGAGDRIVIASGDSVAIGGTDFVHFNTPALVEGSLTVNGGAGVVTLRDGAALSGTGMVNAGFQSFAHVSGGTVTDYASGTITVSDNGTQVIGINFGAGDAANNSVNFTADPSAAGGTVNGVTYSVSGTGVEVFNDAADPLFFTSARADATSNLSLNVSGLDPSKTYEVQILQGGATPNLNTLNNFATGTYSITADGQTFAAHVDHDGTSGWLLIGRGREGWDFDTDGQGAVDEVIQGLGTSAAFAPKAYSDAIVNDLLARAGLTMADVEIRIRRASTPDGTGEYQEVRWRNFVGNGDLFTFNIEDSQYTVTEERLNAPAGLAGAEIGSSTGNTRDHSPSGNDADRIFTWPWASHGNQRGFSYGGAVSNGSNSPTSFLWESGNENHAIPYTEVYIRALNPGAGSGAGTRQNFDITAMGTDTGQTLFLPNLTFGGNGSDAESKKVITFTVTGESGFTYTIQPDGAPFASISGFQIREIIPAGTILAPGADADGDFLGTGADEIGRLETGNLLLNSATTVDFDLNGPSAGTDYDQIKVTGTVHLGNAILDVALHYAAPAGQVFVLVDNDGSDPLVGRFTDSGGNQWRHGAAMTLGGQVFQLLYNVDAASVDFNLPATLVEGTGNDVVLLNYGPAETSVSIDGSGNLVIADIAAESADQLDISMQTIDGADYYVIRDTNSGPLLAMTTSIPGAHQPFVNEVRVLVSAVTGGLRVITDHPDAAAAIDSFTVSSPLTFAGDVIISAESIHLNGHVSTPGFDHTYNGAVTLGASVELTSNDLAINGSLALGPHILTVDIAGAGSVIGDVTAANGGLTKEGEGTLTITGAASGTGFVGRINEGTLAVPNLANTVAGTWTVESGATLKAAAFGTASGLGSANVVLNGGKLDFDATTGSRAGAIDHFGFQPITADAPLNLHLNGGLMSGGDPTSHPNFFGHSLLTTGPAYRGLDFDTDADFSNAGVVSAADNYANLWIGYFTPNVSGSWSFRALNEDDRSGIWIDTSQNGTFESDGTLNDLRGEQLTWDDTTNRSVNLIAGETYLIAFTHREATGNSFVDYRFTGPAGSGFGTDTRIRPDLQPTLWRTYADSSQPATLVNNIFVTATDSTIDYEGDLSLNNLTFASSGTKLNVAVSDVGTLAFKGTSTLPAGPTTFDLIGGARLELNNIVETGGAASVIYSGSGTVSLPTANTYNGDTAIRSGVTVEMGNNASLGAETGKTVIESGGTLDIRGFRAGANGNELVEVQGSGAPGTGGAIINSGAAQTNAFRRLTLTGDTTIHVAFRIDVRNTGGAAAFDMNGFTLTKTGAAEFCIVNATVTNAGGVNANQGIFRIEGSTDFDGPTATISVVNGATLNFWNNIQTHDVNVALASGANLTTNNGAGAGPTVTGTVTLNGMANLNLQKDLTLTGQVTGTGGINQITGTGMLTLTNDTNNFAGAVALMAGTLRATAGNALGSTSGGIYVASGASLFFDAAGGAFSVPAENMVLAGMGVGGNGALRTSGNDVTLAGNIALLGNSLLVNETAGTELTLTGNISREQTGALTVSGAGNVTVNGDILNQDFTLSAITARAFNGVQQDIANATIITNDINGTTAPSSTGVLTSNLAFATGQFTSSLFTSPPLTLVDNFTTIFETTLTVVTPGVYTFAATNNDDGAAVWLKPSANASFVTADRLQGIVVNNNTAVATRTLAAGTYTLVYAHRENAGGESVTGRILGPTVTGLTNGTQLPIVNSSATAGPNDLVKTGTGTLRLNGENIHNGTTTVSGGALIINGVHTGGDNITVSAGASLGGSGTITLADATRAITVDGSLATGDPEVNDGIGTLTVHNDIVLNGVNIFQINGTASDTLHANQANRSVTIGTAATLTVIDNDDPAPGSMITLIKKDGTAPVNGIFSGLAEGFTITDDDGHPYVISYAGDDGNDVVLFVGAPETNVDLSGGVLTITDMGADSVDQLVIQIVNIGGTDYYQISDNTPGRVLTTTNLAGGDLRRPQAGTVLVRASLVTALVIDTAGSTPGVEAGDTVTISGLAPFSLSGGISITAAQVDLAPGANLVQPPGSGPLSLTSTSININAGSNSVILDHPLNDFNGALNITAASAALAGQNDLELGASQVSGNLHITAGGNITDSGVSAVGGNLEITAIGNVNMNQLAVDGSIGVQAGGSAEVFNDSNITFANWSVDGNLTASALSGNVSIAAGVTVASANGNILLNAEDNFTLAEGGTLNSSGNIVINIDTADINDPAQQPGYDPVFTADATATVLGWVNAQSLTINGGSDVDYFIVAPQDTGGAPIYVNGNDPTSLAGDLLTIAGFPGAVPDDPSNLASGTYTFPGKEQVHFSSIERDNEVPQLADLAILEIPNINNNPTTTLRGTILDFGDKSQHMLFISWGDGSQEAIHLSSPPAHVTIDTQNGAFTVRHTYAQDGIYQVTVLTVDSFGARSFDAPLPSLPMRAYLNKPFFTYLGADGTPGGVGSLFGYVNTFNDLSKSPTSMSIGTRAGGLFPEQGLVIGPIQWTQKTETGVVPIELYPQDIQGDLVYQFAIRGTDRHGDQLREIVLFIYGQDLIDSYQQNRGGDGLREVIREILAGDFLPGLLGQNAGNFNPATPLVAPAPQPQEIGLPLTPLNGLIAIGKVGEPADADPGIATWLAENMNVSKRDWRGE